MKWQTLQNVAAQHRELAADHRSEAEERYGPAAPATIASCVGAKQACGIDFLDLAELDADRFGSAITLAVRSSTEKPSAFVVSGALFAIHRVIHLAQEASSLIASAGGPQRT
ncbi:hypothetical protein [Mesorhizobium huakuii]